MDIVWKDGFVIRAFAKNGEVTLSANKEGMLSLADILLSLAQNEPGTHIHLDEYNSLEDGSASIIIEIIP